MVRTDGLHVATPRCAVQSARLALRFSFSQKRNGCERLPLADERRVVAAAKSPQEALKKVHAKGERDPILMWAPKEHSAYIV